MGFVEELFQKRVEELVEAFIQINSLFKYTKLIICGRYENSQKIKYRTYEIINNHKNIIK